MKKIIASLSLVGLLTGAGNAMATPVILDVAGAPFSMVTVTENNDLFSFSSTLTAKLSTGLDNYNFTPGDNQSQKIDFFTLTAAGFGIDTYSIMATLAFDSPLISGTGISGTGSGGGLFGTFFGKISGGIRNWDTQPTDITNNGGDIFPIPEPTTMLLMGTGLAGIFGFSRGRIPRTV